MATKQIKEGENQPLLYTQHLDLYKLQPRMQRSVIVKQTEQTGVTEENEKKYAENREQTHHLIEEVNVVDQHNMQTDVTEENEKKYVENKEQTHHLIEEVNVVGQHNIQTDVTEETQQKQIDEQFVESSNITWQNKSFKDMNNEEKVYFLLNRPHYISNVKCIVKTEKASYVGVITSYENKVLQMVVPSHIGDFLLNIEDIISIRMAGL
ncbi:CotO family spore coat protein [Bacillus sp. WLY-B-L8]|uniref:CotO family spore coat protein n=1 Tax=Bacillus multifaciens TaxID=3068506 RepID=UPI002741430C|nr:CotO family spore coat protein [Bacillus sp. WLY-B-L8]MDP7977619.1 CotO family spore coat protein [Bacillus sp. WLY-B-L8]